MQYSNILAIAVSASLSAVTSASPLSIISNKTTNAASIYFGNLSVSLTADDVFHHMVQHNLVHWTPHGNGSVADIPEGKWLGIIKSATSNSTLIKDVEKAAKSIHRRGSESIGSVEGYAGTINCYGSGAVDPDANVVNSVTDACNALVGTSLPPLAKGSLRVWQTGQQADWHGEASYVRFSTKLLTDGFKYDITQCTQALNNFDTYCQDDSGWTRGGEITISGDIMFNADPTDISTGK